MITWRGPYERVQPSYYSPHDPPYSYQEYEMYVGAVVKLTSFRGRGGQYNGSMSLPGGNHLTFKQVTLEEAKTACERYLAVWMANAGISFDEELLKLVK